MKTLGLIVMLAIGVLAMVILLVPIGVRVTVTDYSEPMRLYGQLRIGQVTLENEGWLPQTVELPELAACAGDTEVPIDVWMETDDAVVRGADAPTQVRLARGERGVFYIIAADATLNENVELFYRTERFSCLTATSRV